MSGGSADYNRYGVLLVVIYFGEGHVALEETVVAGVGVMNFGFIGVSLGVGSLCPSRSFHDG